MSIETKLPSHLTNPLLRMLLGITFFAIGITAIFIITERLLPISGRWHPYVSALPGLGLCSVFLVLRAYLRHHDELKRQLNVQALAASGVAGIGVLLVSASRSVIGGYEEFSGGVIMFVMAIAYAVASMFLSWRHR